MKWDVSLSVGVETLDRQHRELMELTDQTEQLFRRAMEDSNLFDEAQALLKGLKQFATQHFSDEEAYLISVDYPMSEVHSSQHRGFIAYLEEVSSERLSHAPEEVLLELFAFLSTWIVDHIRGDDFEYKYFVEQVSEDVG